MEKEIFSIITAIVSLAGIVFFGYFSVFYKARRRSIKIYSFVFLMISVLSTLITVLIEATYPENNYLYRAELLFNIEVVLLIIVLMTFALWVTWYYRGSINANSWNNELMFGRNTRQFEDNFTSVGQRDSHRYTSIFESRRSRIRTSYFSSFWSMLKTKNHISNFKINAYERKTNLAFSCYFYIMIVSIIVAWVVITADGDSIPSDRALNMPYYVANSLGFIQWITLVLFIIAFLITCLKVTWIIFSSIKSRTFNKGEKIPEIIEVLGFLLVDVVLLMMFIAFNQIQNKSNWLGTELNSFLVDVYSDGLSYMMIYFSIGSALLISTRWIKDAAK